MFAVQLIQRPSTSALISIVILSVRLALIRGIRRIALLSPDRSTRRNEGQRHAPAALYPREKDPVPIVEEAGWAPGPVWTGAENLALTGIRSLDRAARS